MKLSITLLLTTVLFLVASPAKAHNPDISTIMLIEKEPGQWLIQLDASLSALDQEIGYVYGENAYSTPEEFKQLVINHFRKQLSISINKNDIQFGESFLQLGHASTLVFDLIDVPQDLTDIIIENKAFKSIHHSKSVFSIVKNGITKKQFTLNNENDYKIKLTLSDNQILLSETTSDDSWVQLFIWALITGFSGLLIVKSGVLKRIFSPTSAYQETIS